MNAVPMRSLDRQAEFAQLLASHRDQLFGYLYALVQNFHDTEELFQETTLILWEKFETFESGTNFIAWACRTSQHVFRNYMRHKNRSRLVFSEEIVAQLAETQQRLTGADTDERKTALARCLETLRERDRLLVRSVYEGKQTMAQLAEREGKAASALYMALSRIRHALFACIQARLAGGESAE